MVLALLFGTWFLHMVFCTCTPTRLTIRHSLRSKQARIREDKVPLQGLCKPTHALQENLQIDIFLVRYLGTVKSHDLVGENLGM